ncbi:MAG: hypothetical protein M3Y21_00860 [Candidatus Eremiobacteraeota bacterium]|nr:hypothetical protein [Candidatus Eremiobacteraeota bacterium]
MRGGSQEIRKEIDPAEEGTKESHRAILHPESYAEEGRGRKKAAGRKKVSARDSSTSPSPEFVG